MKVKEVWKKIEWSEGHYLVSNLGRVKCTKISKHYRGWSKLGIVKPGFRGSGYPYACLCVNGKSRAYDVHALVAATFLGPRPEGWEVNHKDLNKGNPKLKNLEYLTKSDNSKHSYRHSKRAKHISETRCTQLKAGLLIPKYGLGGKFLGMQLKKES